jgi:putative oxidoreductase
MAIVDRPFLATPEWAPTFDVTGWVLRISAGMLFLGVGFAKFSSDSYWVRLFADIGLGDWFRYLTGALQAASGLLFLVPRTVYPAAVLAGSTMIGVVVVHMFVLDTGIGGAIFPLALLAFIAVVAGRRPD